MIHSRPGRPGPSDDDDDSDVDYDEVNDDDDENTRVENPAEPEKHSQGGLLPVGLAAPSWK